MGKHHSRMRVTHRQLWRRHLQDMGSLKINEGIQWRIAAMEYRVGFNLEAHSLCHSCRRLVCNEKLWHSRFEAKVQCLNQLMLRFNSCWVMCSFRPLSLSSCWFMLQLLPAHPLSGRPHPPSLCSLVVVMKGEGAANWRPSQIPPLPHFRHPLGSFCLALSQAWLGHSSVRLSSRLSQGRVLSASCSGSLPLSL